MVLGEGGNSPAHINDWSRPPILVSCLIKTSEREKQGLLFLLTHNFKTDLSNDLLKGKKLKKKQNLGTLFAPIKSHHPITR